MRWLPPASRGSSSGDSTREQFGFADDLAARAAEPAVPFRAHLRRRRASIEE